MGWRSVADYCQRWNRQGSSEAEQHLARSERQPCYHQGPHNDDSKQNPSYVTMNEVTGSHGKLDYHYSMECIRIADLSIGNCCSWQSAPGHNDQVE
jgi:hypothetical protein